MSNGTAPTCPISHSQPTQRPRQPPAVDVANIPPAHNLRSVINAINMLNNVVQHVTIGTPQINNVYPPTEEGIPAPVEPLPPPPQYMSFGWRESSRDYTEQNVINPDDVGQRVSIKTLSYVTWTQQVIGHRLTYKGSGA